jgi:hypothetical protein
MSIKQTITIKKFFLQKVTSLIIVATSSFVLVFLVNDSILPKLKSNDLKSSVKAYEEDFYKTTNALIDQEDSLSININSIKKIFNSIDRKSNGKLFNYGFINVLEDYSVYLLTTETEKDNNNFYLIVNLINEELKGEPFNQLKSEQKRILLNLQNSLKTQDVKNGMYNLNELNDVLRIQNENIEKLERQNAWSIPLAIIGVILTLLFGIISLVKSFRKVETNNNNS